jgi:hypothetical protein
MNKEEISLLLSKYKNLQECILLRIEWLDYFKTVEITINNVWDGEGRIRKDLEHEEPIVLRFRLVQEFLFNAGLNEAMSLDPDKINWGINEIAFIKMNENSPLVKKYESLPIEYSHTMIEWEKGINRRIDVVSAELEIIERKLRVIK